MEVDTGTFRAIQARAESVDALAADVAGIKDRLRQLHFNRLLAFTEGAYEGAEQAIANERERMQREQAQQAHAGRPRHARPRGERPGYLRLVSGGGR